MVIKVAFFCASIFVVYATAPAGVAVHNTGVSTTSKHQDSHGNYAFEYEIVDEHGASNSRSESGDVFGNKKGSYTLYDTDGRARTVDYIADEHGFRAVVNTNEPGTAQSYPAGAIINSPYHEPAAPASAPVSIVHDVPVKVSTHVVPASHTSKSIVSHAAPVPVVHASPVAISHTAPIAVAHAAPVPVTRSVPSTYSTKSIISHDVPATQAVSIPHVYSPPLSYSGKSVVSHAAVPAAVIHSSPLAYSTKSLVSYAPSVKNIAHPVPAAIASPGYFPYSSKFVASSGLPLTKHYVSASPVIRRYKSIFSDGLGFGDFGYSHGLLGPQFNGFSYNTKLYNNKLYGNGLRDLLHSNAFDNGFYGYGIHRPYIGGLGYHNDIYGYGGHKAYY